MSRLATDKNEPDSKWIWRSILLTVFFLFVTVVGSYYFFIALLSVDQNDKQLNDTKRLRERLDDESRRALKALRWIDRDKGIVKIPIDVAIDRVIDDYN